MSNLLSLIASKIPASTLELESIARTACYRYKVYDIPKREGRGFRTIAQPAPEVKWIQSVVVDEVLGNWPLHQAATAYRKGFSTAHHAALHLDSRFLLKLDFSNFFPSIGAVDVARHVAAHTSLSEQDQRLLVNILTWRNKRTGQQCLSIGAPSSPFVSNSMLFEFDARIDELCSAVGVRYSRYADDLAFSTSTDGVLDVVADAVQQTLDRLPYPRLSLNEKKSVNVSRRHRRSLVGLILTPDGKISIGREQKRQLRAQIHRFTLKDLEPSDEGSLRGMLAYVLSVEPEFVVRMTDHYGENVLASLGISVAAIKRRLKQA